MYRVWLHTRAYRHLHRMLHCLRDLLLLRRRALQGHVKRVKLVLELLASLSVRHELLLQLCVSLAQVLQFTQPGVVGLKDLVSYLGVRLPQLDARIARRSVRPRHEG